MGPRGHPTQQCMLPFDPSLCFALVVECLFRRRSNNLFQRCSNGVLTKTVFENKFFSRGNAPGDKYEHTTGDPQG